MKCCKVIATYMGDRRPDCNGPSNAGQVLYLLRHLIGIERALDPGIDMDTIIVNNINNNRGYEEGANYLRLIDGSATKRGKIHVVTRENTLAAWGAYNHVWELYGAAYDYYLFTEDDTIPTLHNYYKIMVDTFEADPHVGLVSIGIIINEDEGGFWKYPYSAGGCGLTSAKVLKQVYSIGHDLHGNGGGSLIPGSHVVRNNRPYVYEADMAARRKQLLDPQPKEFNIPSMALYHYLQECEVRSGESYSLLNLQLVNVSSLYPGICPLPSNWKKHHTYITRMNDKEFAHKYLYDQGYTADNPPVFLHKVGL